MMPRNNEIQGKRTDKDRRGHVKHQVLEHAMIQAVSLIEDSRLFLGVPTKLVFADFNSFILIGGSFVQQHPGSQET